MTSKKTAPLSVSNARLVALQKLGLMRDVSAKANLTSSQKRKVADLTKKYHEVATAPKGTYKVQDVSGFFPGQVKALERDGVTVINGKAYVRKDNYQDVRIVKKKFATGPGTHETIIGIERKTDKRKKTFEFIGSPIEQAEWRERLVREYAAGNLKDGQFVALQAYDNSPMARSNTISIESIFKYESQIKYHDDPDKVRRGLKLVIVTVKDFESFSANEKTRKQKGSEKYQRGKKAKQLQVKKLTGRVKRK